MSVKLFENIFLQNLKNCIIHIIMYGTLHNKHYKYFK